MKQEIAKKIINKTISDYSKIAVDFDRTRSKTQWQVMQALADFAGSGERILDFGCGNGRLFDLLKSKNIEYVGIDPVEEFIDICREKYSDHKNAHFAVFDFDAENFKLNFPDNYFDKIFAFAVFHHLPSRKLRADVLRELKRVLKDDGKIFLTVWNLWRGWTLRGITKFFLLKIFDRIRECDGVAVGDLDFGDLFIDYRVADKKVSVQRYHHAFTRWGIGKMAKDAGLKAEKIFYDNNKFNLCASFKK